MRLEPRAGADVPVRPAAARRADQPPRPRRGALARGLARQVSRARCSSSRTTATSSTPSSTASCTSTRASSSPTPATTRSSSASARASSRCSRRRTSSSSGRSRTCTRSSTASARRRRKAKQAQSRIKALERMELIAAAHVDSPFEFSFAPTAKTARQLVLLEDAVLRLSRPSAGAAVRELGHPGRRPHRPARPQRRRQVHAAEGASPARWRR